MAVPRDKTHPSLLMAITSRDDPRQQDLLALVGNIEILVGDLLVELGPFDGALLLLPSLEVLALGVLRLRELHSNIEIVLVGDSPSLWLAGKPGAETVEILFRKRKAGPVLRTAFDAACERAARDFLSWLEAQRPVSTWSADARNIRNVLASVWPSLA